MMCEIAVISFSHVRDLPSLCRDPAPCRAAGSEQTPRQCIGCRSPVWEAVPGKRALGGAQWEGGGGEGRRPPAGCVGNQAASVVRGLSPTGASGMV